jgi:hypothetical protein
MSWRGDVNVTGLGADTGLNSDRRRLSGEFLSARVHTVLRRLANNKILDLIGDN